MDPDCDFKQLDPDCDFKQLDLDCDFKQLNPDCDFKQLNPDCDFTITIRYTALLHRARQSLFQYHFSTTKRGPENPDNSLPRIRI